jgi:hypothetical protein
MHPWGKSVSSLGGQSFPGLKTELFAGNLCYDLRTFLPKTLLYQLEILSLFTFSFHLVKTNFIKILTYLQYILKSVTVFFPKANR